MEIYSDFKILGGDLLFIALMAFGFLAMAGLSAWISIVNFPKQSFANQRNANATKRFLFPGLACGLIAMVLAYQSIIVPFRWRLYIPNGTDQTISVEINRRDFEIAAHGSSMIDIRGYIDSLSIVILDGGLAIYDTIIREHGAFIGSCNEQEVVAASEIEYADPDEQSDRELASYLLTSPGFVCFSENVHQAVFDFGKEAPKELYLDEHKKREIRFLLENVSKANL